MDCDGKFKNCTAYNIHVYHKSFHWIAESAIEVNRRYDRRSKHDFTSYR